MKAQKPAAPIDAPSGTVEIGGPIDWFSISLNVRGEDLVPEEITKIMRRGPDRAQQKDKPLYREDGSLMRVPRSGRWAAILRPEDTDEWDCGEAMLELLATLPSDPTIWCTLAARYKISFFVGLCMKTASKGFELSPEVMSYLAARKITAGFDIYYEPEEEG
jgi:hypothetical protein